MKPIFFDISKKRHKIVKRTILFMLFCILFLSLNFVISIFIKPYLPTPQLKETSNIEHLYKQRISINKRKSHFFKNDIYHVAEPHEVSGDSTIDLYAFYVERDDAGFSSLQHNIDKIDVLVPEWLNLESSGVVQLYPDRAKNTLSYVRSQRKDLKISPLINNYDQKNNTWNAKVVHDMLQSQISQERIIGALIDYIDQRNLDGISIDFENLDTLTWQQLIPFLSTLHSQLVKHNAELTINIPFDNDSVPYQDIAKVVDKLIFMAYDEHWASSNDGPISSLSWYIKGLQKIQQSLSPDKYIIALGNYGYDWLQGSKQPQTLTRQEAMTTMQESSGTIQFDQVSGNPMFSYIDEVNKTHNVWYLDAVTIFNQIILGRNIGQGSFALWRMGSEDPSLWSLIDNHTFDDDIAPKQLKNIVPGYDVIYNGSGSLLRLAHVALTGTRTIEYDTGENLITNETLGTFPSPYQIDRYSIGKDKQILLTFDDGPSNYTDSVLDILKKYNVPAVFFIIGANAEEYPNTVERIINEGHIIGSHTFTHPDISVITKNQFALELNSTQRLLEGITQDNTLLFRPPYSVDIEPRNASEAESLIILNNLGYYIVGLDIDPNDWENPGVDTIVHRVESLSSGGHVMLLHDGGGDRSQTIAALPRIITSLRSQGYSFVSADTLMGVDKNVLMPPLTTSQKFISLPNWIIIHGTSIFTWFIYYIFIVGLILGLTRLLFVIVLALYQKYLYKNKRFTPGYNPLVSVIVPAYNEGIVIVKTLENLLESTYHPLEIILVDDGSSDDTLSIAKKHFSHIPNIHILTQENGGKSTALNTGIDYATGEIVIVQDADTLFEKDAIGFLVRHFADACIGAVAGNVKVGNIDSIMGRCQALEYMTSQNLDRRVFDVLNSITVVPGAIGARRKKILEGVGGFTNDTLAEDSDITIRVLREGRKIVHEESAIAWTEAPETVKAFMKQRFRWMFGTLQVTWKHADMLFSFSQPGLGWFAIPNLFIFQLLFPLLGPVLDFIGLITLCITVFHMFTHFSQTSYVSSIHILLFYVIFVGVDALITIITFVLEGEKNWKLGIRFPVQRWIYRVLMYRIGLKVIYTALTGKGVGWNKLQRTGAVSMK